MSILIGADLVPTSLNSELFIKADVSALIGDNFQQFLKNADFRIFNLETPLTKNAHPIQKLGPNLIADPETVAGIKALGVDLLTLANNHILDQGINGLIDTQRVLSKVGIKYTGVGTNIYDACKPSYFEIKGKRYGIYACAEHEFSIAGEQTPGANPFDPLESLDHVASLKRECDFVIVLYHGGKEHYRFPSPHLQHICRKLVEKGADLVICQHSHCVGCKEEYQNGTIVYGQGNFLFSKHDNEFWNTGLLIQINDKCEISYIPFEKKENGIRLAEDKRKEEILQDFLKRSEEIQIAGVVEKKYEDLARNSISPYILLFSGLSENYVYRAFNKLSGHRLQRWISRRMMTKNGVGIQNCFECETHQELIIKGLKMNR